MFSIIFCFLFSCVQSHRLHITGAPKNAVVLINGIPSCYESPCIQTLEQGTYSVDIQAENYVATSFSITLKDDYTKSVDLSPKGGWLSVRSIPSSLPISINGALLGRTPIQRTPIDYGSHKIEVHDPCFVSAAQSVDVSSGQAVAIVMEPIAHRHTLKVSLIDQSSRVIPGIVYADGVELGTSLNMIEIPLCTQHLMVLAKDVWGQKNLDLLKEHQEMVMLEQQPLLKEEEDGLLGFEPPECIQNGSVDKQCVQVWFDRIRKRAEEKNAHLHHEGCAHE